MSPQPDKEPRHPAASSHEAAAPAEGLSPGRLLSGRIWRLSKRAETGSLTMDEALQAIEPTPPLLLCALLALPFCQPVPTVGLSIPFGIGIASIALGIALGRRARVPAWLRRRQIPAQLFPLLLRATARFVGFAERFLRPRAQWMFLPPLGRVWAVVMIVNAFCLSLPLPIPLSNLFPAASVVAICLGSMQKDGLSVAAGLAAFAMTIGFLLFLGIAGASIFS